MNLQQKVDSLIKALTPFAKMDRPDCDLNKQASRRGTGYDASTIFSQDFRAANEALELVGDPPRTSSCQLKSDWTPGRCCCNCIHLAKDMSHPDTDGGNCDEQRGFVCLAPEFGEVSNGRVYSQVSSDWTEHGMCELHDEAPASMNIPIPGGKVSSAG